MTHGHLPHPEVAGRRWMRVRILETVAACLTSGPSSASNWDWVLCLALPAATCSLGLPTFRLPLGLYAPLLPRRRYLRSSAGRRCSAAAAYTGYPDWPDVGLTIRARPGPERPLPRRPFITSQILMFVMLGLQMTPGKSAPHLSQPSRSPWISSSWSIVPLIVIMVCLAPLGFPWRDQLFVGWVGLFMRFRLPRHHPGDQSGSGDGYLLQCRGGDRHRLARAAGLDHPVSFSAG